LQVASRTSAFRFRGGNVDVREIGHRLNVVAVLEGSVRRSGKRLRITAQLVNVTDGYHLWSERYDRQITDIFEIQDEITSAIIKTLAPTLAGQQTSLTRRHSENLQAYELYLKGRRFWDQRTESTIRAGLECFRAAIDLDPEYTLAHAGVADSYSVLAVYGHISLIEGRPKAEAAMRKAAELDSTLAESHFSLGFATCVFGSRLAESLVAKSGSLTWNGNGSLNQLVLTDNLNTVNSHRALRTTCLRVRPFAFLHHPSVEPFLDQPQDAGVSDAMLHELGQPTLVEVIEVGKESGY
jgi:adenylate cyclase